MSGIGGGVVEKRIQMLEVKAAGEKEKDVVILIEREQEKRGAPQASPPQDTCPSLAATHHPTKPPGEPTLAHFSGAVSGHALATTGRQS